jgi:hypothetical protein
LTQVFQSNTILFALIVNDPIYSPARAIQVSLRERNQWDGNREMFLDAGMAVAFIVCVTFLGGCSDADRFSRRNIGQILYDALQDA